VFGSLTAASASQWRADRLQPALHWHDGPLGPGGDGWPGQDREVILINNAGVSSSSGEVPTTFEEMGAGAVAFIKGLELTKGDVLAFSRRSFRFGRDWPSFAPIPMTSKG
jgi:hypothetical protein